MHVRQTWTKRRKMKEGRKTGYILETKKTSQLESRKGWEQKRVEAGGARKPARVHPPPGSSQQHSHIFPHRAHTPSNDSGSPVFEKRVCHVITPATLDIPEGIPLMPAP